MTPTLSAGVTTTLNSSGDPAFQSRLASVYAHALAGRSYRQLARQLGINQETLRRMVVTQTCSVRLLTVLCEKFGINAHWLLTGRGEPTRLEDRRSHLERATPRELCRALAEQLSIVLRSGDQASRPTIMDARESPQGEGPSPLENSVSGGDSESM